MMQITYKISSRRLSFRLSENQYLVIHFNDKINITLIEVLNHCIGGFKHPNMQKLINVHADLKPLTNKKIISSIFTKLK